MSILIKNGTVYDGTGAPPRKTDVLIQESHIARLGTLSKGSATTLFDATGAIVAPGFIDTVSGQEAHEPFDATERERLLKRGVTTVLGGDDGLSLAPFSSRTGALLLEWGASRLMNAHWESVREFLRVVETHPMALNFGTFVGLGTLKRACGIPYGADMTDREREAVTHLLKKNLAEGAFGLSVHMAMPHSETVAFHELAALFKAVGAVKRVGIIVPRFSDEEALPAIGEFFELARVSHARMVLHRVQVLFAGKDFKEVRTLLDREMASLDTYFDMPASPVVSFPLAALLPRWFREASRKKMVEGLSEKDGKERLIAYFKKILKGPKARLVIDEVPPSLAFLRGTTLASFATDHEVPPWRALYLLMRLTKLKAHIRTEWASKNAFEELLAHQKGIVSGDFPAFLSSLASREDLPLEKAIHKITGLPAEKFRIPKRGVLKEGNAADVVLLREGKPETVIVNGVVAVREGAPIHGVYAGRVIRASHS